MKKIFILFALALACVANAQTNPYSVALADAVWNVEDMLYYNHDGYKFNSSHSSNTTSYIYACWCVDNESKPKTLRGSSAYIPSIHPNKYTLSQASTPNTTMYGMDDTLAIRMYHNTSNYKPFIMLPQISDAEYTNLELEFYARRGVTSTETDDSKLSVGYIVLSSMDDTTSVYDHVVNLQSIEVANGTYGNGYNKYTVSLASLPTGAHVVFYEGTQANNIVYLDNISIHTKTGTNPGPGPKEEEGYKITYNLTGCTANEGSPTEYDEEESYTQIYFTEEAGYTLSGAEVSVTCGTNVLSDDYMDEYGYFFFDPSYKYLFFSIYKDVDADIVITITCKQETGSGITLPETPAAATFEEFEIDEDSVYRPASWEVGKQYMLSGSYIFCTEKTSWGYTDIQVVNYKNQYVPGGSDGYLACCAAGAAEGDNYAVCNINGLYSEITLTPTIVSGMYVTNTQYARRGFTTGDGYARAFQQGDWFKLTITGVRNGAVVGAIDYYLADYRTSEFTYAVDWEWVSLTSLGEVDALQFSIDGTDKGQWGLNTAAYFCFDNLGGTPTYTGVSQQHEAKASKMLLNGEIVIRRGGQLYTLTGAQK